MRGPLSISPLKSSSVAPLASWLKSATAGFVSLAFCVMASVPLAAHANPTAATSAGITFAEAIETRESTNVVTILGAFGMDMNGWNGGEQSIGILPLGGTPFFVNGILKPIPLDGSPVLGWATMRFDIGNGSGVQDYFFDFAGRNQIEITGNLTVTAGSISTGQLLQLFNLGGNQISISAGDFPVYTMSPVPEPGTLPLLGAGALALAAIATRKKRKDAGAQEA